MLAVCKEKTKRERKMGDVPHGCLARNIYQARCCSASFPLYSIIQDDSQVVHATADPVLLLINANAHRQEKYANPVSECYHQLHCTACAINYGEPNEALQDRYLIMQ